MNCFKFSSRILKRRVKPIKLYFVADGHFFQWQSQKSGVLGRHSQPVCSMGLSLAGDPAGEVRFLGIQRVSMKACMERTFPCPSPRGESKNRAGAH